MLLILRIEKIKMQWDESAYQTSTKSNKKWLRYKGPKSAKNGEICEKMWKFDDFSYLKSN